MSKTAETYFYEFRASADADAAMSLLRSRDALLHLALMAAHLGEGQIVDGQSLAAMIGEDLAALGTAAGGEDGDAGRDPEASCGGGRGRAGCTGASTTRRRTERYQLTAGAHQAVQQIRSVRRHSSTATQSALAMVMTELRQIAAEASPDPRQRLALREQIAALEEQLEAAPPGRPFPPPPPS